MVVISDTTTISNLFHIDKLWLLEKLYSQVAIPQAVFDELEKTDRNGKRVHTLKNVNWINILSVKDKDLVSVLMLTLDKGEAEAIALAQETHADLLIIDEIKGRKYAKQLKLKIIGLIGILLLAKEEKLIENVTEVLVELRVKAGFWVSDRLFETVSKLANES